MGIRFFDQVNRFGFLGYVRLLLYPLTTIATTPIQLLRTLSNSRILLSSKLQSFPHFCPFSSQVALFYWKRAFDFHKYGRRGISPITGLGNYHLARLFFYTFLSLFIYWKAGAFSLLVGMYGWLFAHLIWMAAVPAKWVALVVLVVSISTMFYGQTFRRQNYNVIGWLFFPVGIYGLMVDQYLISGIGWILCSFGSITSIYIAMFLVACDSFFDHSIQPILFLLPAFIKASSHFIYLLSLNKKTNIILTIAKAIGLTKTNVKYKRNTLKAKFPLAKTYYLLLNLQFFFMVWYLEAFPYLLATAIVIYFFNSVGFRFADEQSMWMMMTSIAIAYTINYLNYYILISLWILISPLPFFIGFRAMRYFDVVPVFRPFNIKPLLDGMCDFIQAVSIGQRILMALNDPDGKYSNIFDGYKTNIEIISYVSGINGIHFLPDWWAVFDTNHEGSVDFWGRTPDEVRRNMNDWNADYVIVYQEEMDCNLDSKWESEGFIVVNAFQWSDYSEQLESAVPLPNWWLLENKSQSFSNKLF